VLGAVADDLARWGLAYLVVGALTGLVAPFGRWGVAVPWLVLVAVADPGVAPRAAYAGLVILAVIGARRARLLAVLAWGCAAGAGLARPGVDGGVASGQPNVVLLVVDTLRADHVGAYGYARDTTPHLDRLARDGVRFTHAWSTSSWTLPAHASLFTGLLPSSHGATEPHPRLDPGPQTLAGALAQRGYRTVGLSANAWVSGGTGLDRGFGTFRFLGDEGLVSQLLLPLVFARPDDLGGRALADAAVAAIEATPGRAPLFLFVNFLEAHEPLGTVPDADRSRYSPTPLDATLGRVWMRDMPRAWARCQGGADLGADSGGGALVCRDGLYRAPPDRVRGTVDRYDAGVAYVDARIGEVWAAVERAGLAENTLFVVTSDHGEHLGEEGRLGHMVWLDEALVSIPLVARFPGRLDPGTVDEQAVDLAWVHDWILALANDTPRPPARDARAEVHAHAPGTIATWERLFGDDFSPAATARRAVTDGTRAIWRDGATVGVGDARRAPTAADVAWVDGAGAALPETTTGAGVDLDPATLRALEALGYVR
jgi:arylsulfatase A-like enzyme